MESQNELADIIYEFSSLLRNNISDERETTLEKEVEFCRKYSYLCMVRYPKSIAYGFKIDPGIEEMRIPKFTLQPLVEIISLMEWTIEDPTMSLVLKP